MDLLQHFLQAFTVTAMRYFIIAGVAFFIFYKLFSPRFAANKIQQRKAGDADFKREIFYSMVSSLVFAIIAALLLFTPVVGYTQMYHDIGKYPLWWIPVSTALALIIHDTYFYWIHRLLHHPALFKHAHLVHHKSTNPSPWASYSFHLLESVLEGGILVVVAIVLPIHPIGLVSFIISGFIINVYGHLGYEVMPKGLRNSFWFEILNTSVHHNLHHSKFKGNYGLYFRVWDRLMGTEHPDYVKEYDRVQASRFGEESIKPNATATYLGKLLTRYAAKPQ